MSIYPKPIPQKFDPNLPSYVKEYTKKEIDLMINFL